MSDAASLLNNSALAFAAYANLQKGRSDDAENIVALLAVSGNNPSLTQITEFASSFPAVITQYADTLANGGMGTGLNATVFADAGGKLTLAIRGTDSLGVGGDASDLVAGQDIVFNGMAYDQIVALVNWWLRATAPTDQMVDQFRLVELAQQSIPEGAVVLRAGTTEGTSYVLDVVPQVLACSEEQGNISAKLATVPDQRVEVTGHSLGGHLGMLFSTIFGGQTGQVTAFNAPGYKDSVVNIAFREAA